MRISDQSTSVATVLVLLLGGVILLVFTPAAWADAGDINSYALQKAATYSQTDTTTPTFANAVGGVIIFESSAGSVPPTPTVQFPGGAIISLTDFGTVWAIAGPPYGSLAALDAAFPNGGYLITIPTTSGGATTYTPTLNSEPTVTAIPTITNTSWSGGVLFLDGSVDNTIAWNVNDAASYNLFLSGSLGDNLFLYGNAADLSVLISAGTLVSGETYSGYLSLLNQSGDSTQIPGVNGQSLSYAQTSFNLDVVPEPSIYVMVLGGMGLLGLVVRRKYAFIQERTRF